MSLKVSVMRWQLSRTHESEFERRGNGNILCHSLDRSAPTGVGSLIAVGNRHARCLTRHWGGAVGGRGHSLARPTDLPAPFVQTVLVEAGQALDNTPSP